ncbi:MAG: PLDc N-terminal domain-containing protein, partial [Firmicutes bacterium]|nr:PLDc N-terminal domain-containing protein [Bacillota bacterium]
MEQERSQFQEKTEELKDSARQLKDKSKRLVKRAIFSRILLVALLLLVQLAILGFAYFRLSGEAAPWVLAGFSVLSFVLAVYIVNRDINPAFKLIWTLIVVAFPVFGAVLYLFVQSNLGARAMRKRTNSEMERSAHLLQPDPALKAELEERVPELARLSDYTERYGCSTVYRDTRVQYFPLGEDKFEEMKERLSEAKDFICLEYFIVQGGVMWDAILEILLRKVREGVEVRLLYDGMGCLTRLPGGYDEWLNKQGIKTRVFSPVHPILSTHQNNRDHRKILVIDGKCAFTGGINLADEYINAKELFGHWKDTAVLLEGPAVRGFTLMFLQLWNVAGKAEPMEDYSRYLDCSRPEGYDGAAGQNKDGAAGREGPAAAKLQNPAAASAAPCTYVLPYGDNPMGTEQVGETVYLDILYKARKYVHIMTPYLVLDNELVKALTTAAKSGIDVKIIIPHIPDKPYAFAVARSFYPDLISCGVRIYEYTPGFIHAKSFVSDDCKATVGTVNLDFRSLYLHFECGAYLYGSSAAAVEEDFQKTLALSREMTLEDYRALSGWNRLWGRVLRLMAPVM